MPLQNVVPYSTYVLQIVLQVTNVQDQLDEIYGQLVELNNIIEQNVTNAIVYVT